MSGTPPFLLEMDVRWRAGSFELKAAITLRERVAALFGPSGSGKTSLLNLLAGTVRPDDGQVRLNGRVLFDARAGISLPPERRGIGYVFQENRLFPHLGVAENLRYSPRTRRREGGRTALPFDAVVAMLGLEPLLGRLPASLSGGEARRVAVGRALLSAPELLILDEPFTGLDQGLKARLLPYLSRVRDEAGLPIVTVSHSVAEILALTDHVVMMDAGRVLGQGEFYTLLRDERVFAMAAALGLQNVLQVQVVAHDEERGITRARLGDQELILPQTDLSPGTQALIGLRPDEIILAREEVHGLSAQNTLRGRVEEVTPITHGHLVRLDLGQPLRAEVTEMARRSLGLEPGATVYALAKTFSFRWHGAVGRSSG